MQNDYLSPIKKISSGVVEDANTTRPSTAMSALVNHCITPTSDFR